MKKNKIFNLFFIFLGSFNLLFAQPGSLDLTFGTGGKLITSFGSFDDDGSSIALQSDGKIVVAGSSGNGSNSDFALARYNSDGTLDNTFGTGGKLTTSFGSFDDNGYSIALQLDGKIVVAGLSSSGSFADFALVRFNSDGTLDNTFGTGGKVTTDFGKNDFANSVMIQIDGKIVVVGYSGDGSGSYFALARYNIDGTLDNTFGTSGKLTTAFGNINEGHSVAIQTDGKIVAAGWSDINSNRNFALARYSSNGTLDNTFGISGKVTTDFGGLGDYGHSVAIQSDGKIVVAGWSNNGTNDDFALVRYNTDGILDNTFGANGKLTTGFGSTSDAGLSVAIQTNNKIIVAGYSGIGSNWNFALVCYNTTGTLDNTFGTGGKLTTDFGSSVDACLSVAIQTDGKIVAAGQSNNGTSNDFALARYNGVITSITETELDEGIKIYPNPISVSLTIETNKYSSIEIINVQGLIVKSINTSNTKTIIDLSKLLGGFYTIKIKTDNGITVRKLIKN